MKKSVKKTILFIVKIPPPINGFTETNKTVVESSLLKSKFNCIYLRKSYYHENRIIGKFIKPIKLMFYLCRLLFILITQKIDLVYFTISPVNQFYRDLCFVIILKLFKKKLVYHLHGKGIYWNSKKNIWNKWLYKYAFKNTFNICLAEKLVDDISHLTNQKIYVLNNGVKVTSSIKKKLAFEKNSFTLLFLSNFIVEKGIIDVIDATKRLIDKGYSVNLVLAGKSGNISIEQIHKYLDENNMSNHVKVIDGVYGQEKEFVLQNSDIFVFPTYYPNEAFPLVLLEAMSYSMPIVATDEGGITEILLNDINGLLVKKNNSIDLAAKLESLILSPESVIKFGKNSKQLFNNKFAINIFEHNLFLILLNIIKSENNE